MSPLTQPQDPQRYAPPSPLPANAWGAPPTDRTPATSLCVCAELLQSHAFLNVGELLRSVDQSFRVQPRRHGRDDTVLTEEYVSDQVRVIYRLTNTGHDEVCVSWIDQETAEIHDSSRLLLLARQIVDIFGGGTNIHLEETAPLERKEHLPYEPDS